VTVRTPELGPLPGQITHEGLDLPTAGGSAWSARLPGRPETAAIVCLFALLCADLLLIRVGVDAQDEGYFVEQASRVLHGELPYRDFDSLYTPGLLYVHALLFNVVGDAQVLAVRTVGLFSRVVLAVSLYLVCRPLVRPWFGILPAAFVLVGLDRLPAPHAV
jgi:hypothetical protein